MYLFPYGYAKGAIPDNNEEIRQLAIDATDAISKVHGKVFTPTTVPNWIGGGFLILNCVSLTMCEVPKSKSIQD